MPVREDLGEVERRLPAEHLPAGDDQPAVLEHAHLAPVLGADPRRRPLARDRLGVVDRAPAALHHHVRQGEVVAEPRVDLDVVGPAHGVDRPVPAGDRAERRLLLAQPGLEPPVDAFAVVPGGVGQDEPPADVRDVRIGEGADEQAERVRRPHRVRVAERDDLGGALAHRPVLRRHLAAARAAQQPHSRLARRDRLDQLVRAVAGGIGRDHDVQRRRRVVEREQVLDAPLDHRLLVVGGDDQRHAREDVTGADAPPPRTGGRRGCERVTGVRPDEGGQRRPEHDLNREHRPPRARR